MPVPISPSGLPNVSAPVILRAKRKGYGVNKQSSLGLFVLFFFKRRGAGAKMFRAYKAGFAGKDK